jgi:tetratricopeptide (TPR) repeat protein
MIRNILALGLLMVLLSGCSLGVKQRWVDFNAYYNTFYNAKQSYQAGIRLMDAQSVTINPERPIRIHQTPSRAGQAQFEKAIEKSADILRNHDNSKWVDDALELIGRSYFQLGQFFAAEQKFNEILAASSSRQVRQRAVLWKSIIFLETNRYNEGIQYINASILSEEFDWNPQTLAELYLVLAQLYVAQEDWDSATSALASGLPDFREDVLRSRGYFLYGQLLERQNLYQEALNAYRGVSRRYPEYQLIYFAAVRQNAIRRELGQYDRAYSEFLAMSRDDKNFDQIGDLNYEIARTLQLKGESVQAFQLYQQVLYNSLRPPTRETISKTHYAIAELYRFNFGDFNIAAAYYDSSARNATDLVRLPINFDASSMAASFRSYARISTQISEKDSLLALGLLPRDEFERVIIQIRDDRLREYQRQLRQDQLRGTTLVNVTPGQETTPSTTSGENGFLNHRNQNLVNQAALSYAALWNERPLVDNWRRLQAVRQTAMSVSDQDEVQETPSADTSDGLVNRLQNVSIPTELNIDLTVIPFTVADQNRMREQIADLSYELGNVFYLNLQMPDSALIHYLRVVEDFSESNILPQAMYTIADIYLSVGDTTTAKTWAYDILDRFPSSNVARVIASRLNLDVELVSAVISDEESALRDYREILSRLDQASHTNRISMLNDYMIRHPNAPNIAEVLFSKAMFYSEAARATPEFIERFQRYNKAQSDWRTLQADFVQRQQVAMDSDTLEIAPTDSNQISVTATDTQRRVSQAILDSVLVAPDFDALYPYLGQYWDSTRVVLTSLVRDFGQSPLAARSRSVLEVLVIPASLRPADEIIAENEVIQLPADVEPEFVVCDVLDQPIRLKVGLPTFLETSGFNAILARHNIETADFEFELTLNHLGRVDQAVSLADADPLGLTENLRLLLVQSAEFEIPTVNRVPVRTACYFAVSIDK